MFGLSTVTTRIANTPDEAEPVKEGIAMKPILIAAALALSACATLPTPASPQPQSVEDLRDRIAQAQVLVARMRIGLEMAEDLLAAAELALSEAQDEAEARRLTDDAVRQIDALPRPDLCGAPYTGAEDEAGVEHAC